MLKSTYPRIELKDHIDECPEQEIQCTFSEMGCKEKLKRRMLQQHLVDGVILHQTVMCAVLTEKVKLYANDKTALEKKLSAQDVIIKNLRKDKEELEQKVDHLTEEIDNLKPKKDFWLENLKFMASKMRVTNWPLYLCKIVEVATIEPFVPVVLKVQLHITKEHRLNNSGPTYHYISTLYNCMPFYSHSKGYKLQLSAKVACHCPTCPKMCFIHGYRLNNLSLSVEVHVIQGEHDVDLKWPYKKMIRVTLLNKETDDGHCTLMQECKSNCEGFEVSQGKAKQPEQLLYMQLATALSTHGIYLPQDFDGSSNHSDEILFPLNLKDEFVNCRPHVSAEQYSSSKYIGECQKDFYVQVTL